MPLLVFVCLALFDLSHVIIFLLADLREFGRRFISKPRCFRKHRGNVSFDLSLCAFDLALPVTFHCDVNFLPLLIRFMDNRHIGWLDGDIIFD